MAGPMYRDRYEIEELLSGLPADYRQAVHGSASTVYSLAFKRGLIDKRELETARARYGQRWNYAGD